MHVRFEDVERWAGWRLVGRKRSRSYQACLPSLINGVLQRGNGNAWILLDIVA
jgi:hypothetical protein